MILAGRTLCSTEAGTHFYTSERLFLCFCDQVGSRALRTCNNDDSNAWIIDSRSATPQMKRCFNSNGDGLLSGPSIKSLHCGIIKGKILEGFPHQVPRRATLQDEPNVAKAHRQLSGSTQCNPHGAENLCHSRADQLFGPLGAPDPASKRHTWRAALASCPAASLSASERRGSVLRLSTGGGRAVPCGSCMRPKVSASPPRLGATRGSSHRYERSKNATNGAPGRATRNKKLLGY